MDRSSSVQDPPPMILSQEDTVKLVGQVTKDLSQGSYSSLQPSILCLSSNLKLHGPSLEHHHGELLDRLQLVLRPACRDNKLDLKSRVLLLEILELRTFNWAPSQQVSNYYKTKLQQISSEMLSGDLHSPSAQGFSKPPPSHHDFSSSQIFYKPPSPHHGLSSSQGFSKPPPSHDYFSSSQGFSKPPPSHDDFSSSQGFSKPPPSHDDFSSSQAFSKPPSPHHDFSSSQGFSKPPSPHHDFSSAQRNFRHSRANMSAPDFLLGTSHLLMNFPRRPAAPNHFRNFPNPPTVPNHFRNYSNPPTAPSHLDFLPHPTAPNLPRNFPNPPITPNVLYPDRSPSSNLQQPPVKNNLQANPQNTSNSGDHSMAETGDKAEKKSFHVHGLHAKGGDLVLSSVNADLLHTVKQILQEALTDEILPKSGSSSSSSLGSSKPELVYQKTKLLELATSPLCRLPPKDWDNILMEIPVIVKSTTKFLKEVSNTVKSNPVN